MDGVQKCKCKFQNPIEQICTLETCKQKGVMCQSCAWDHRQHDNFVKPLSVWQEELTNDSVVQRLNHIKTNQNQIQCFDEFAKLAQRELVSALKSKCDQITIKLLSTSIPIDKTIEAIKQLGQNNYTDKTILHLIKDFYCIGIHDKLDDLELEAFKKTQLVCSQIIKLMEKVQEVFDFCDHKPQVDIVKLRQQFEFCMQKAEQPKRQTLVQQPHSYFKKEELKDNKLNEFLIKMQVPQLQKVELKQQVQQNIMQQKIEVKQNPQFPEYMSQSTLNYLRYNGNGEKIRSERQSFYLPSQRPNLLLDEDAYPNQRGPQIQVQPLSTRSVPYKNVVLQKNYAVDNPPLQIMKVEIGSQSQRLIQRDKPSVQQFSSNKPNHIRKDQDQYEHMSKSFYEQYAQQKN